MLYAHANRVMHLKPTPATPGHGAVSPHIHLLLRDVWVNPAAHSPTTAEMTMCSTCLYARSPYLSAMRDENGMTQRQPKIPGLGG